VVLVVTAAPASADPAKPGDYRSVVTHVDPPTDAVAVKVVGGDGFLDLKVKPGHDVIVNGYAGGPWLHIRTDGTIEENQLSPATFRNGDRYARTLPPDNVTDETETTQPPQWKVIGSGGEYIWHDHRIHWMSPQPPPAPVKAGDLVYPDWTVQLTVDGQPTTVHGQLAWVRDVSPIPYFAIAIVLTVGLILFGRKSAAAAAIAVLIASIAALVVGWRSWTSIPSQAGPNPLEIALPLIAVVASALAVGFRKHPLSVVGILAAVSALGGWCIERFAVLLNPVLPTELSFGLDRTATAVAIGACIGAAVIAVRAGVVLPGLPKLTFEDEEDDESS
jgi:hypothetical protein